VIKAGGVRRLAARESAYRSVASSSSAMGTKSLVTFNTPEMVKAYRPDANQKYKRYGIRSSPYFSDAIGNKQAAP